jgi:hypothetical protein
VNGGSLPNQDVSFDGGSTLCCYTDGRNNARFDTETVLFCAVPGAAHPHCGALSSILRDGGGRVGGGGH